MQRASRRLGISQVGHVDILLGYAYDVLTWPDSSCQMTGRGKAAVSALRRTNAGRAKKRKKKKKKKTRARRRIRIAMLGGTFDEMHEHLTARS